MTELLMLQGALSLDKPSSAREDTATSLAFGHSPSLCSRKTQLFERLTAIEFLSALAADHSSPETPLILLQSIRQRSLKVARVVDPRPVP